MNTAVNTHLILFLWFMMSAYRWCYCFGGQLYYFEVLFALGADFPEYGCVSVLCEAIRLPIHEETYLLIHFLGPQHFPPFLFFFPLIAIDSY